jgi:hypothetical protein
VVGVASPRARRLAAGGYLAWLAAVVLLVVGRFTPLPLLPGVNGGVALGALAFFCLGCGRLARRTVGWLRRRR